MFFVCRVVEFKDEEFVKKAMEVMNKHDLSGRPLNIKEVCSMCTHRVQIYDLVNFTPPSPNILKGNALHT